jgi:hypothetical protein
VDVAAAPRLALATCAEVPDLDPEGKLLLAACREAGIEAEAAIWDDADVDWEGFELVVLRSTWDYKDKPAEFRAWCGRLGRRLRNTPEIVAWNVSKHYLEVLRGWGFPVVATVFLEPGACHEEIAGTFPGAGDGQRGDLDVSGRQRPRLPARGAHPPPGSSSAPMSSTIRASDEGL